MRSNLCNWLLASKSWIEWNRRFFLCCLPCIIVVDITDRSNHIQSWIILGAFHSWQFSPALLTNFTPNQSFASMPALSVIPPLLFEFECALAQLTNRRSYRGSSIIGYRVTGGTTPHRLWLNILKYKIYCWKMVIYDSSHNFKHWKHAREYIQQICNNLLLIYHLDLNIYILPEQMLTISLTHCTPVYVPVNCDSIDSGSGLPPIRCRAAVGTSAGPLTF